MMVWMVLSAGLAATSADTAEAVVHTMIDQALAILRDTKSHDERVRLLRARANEYFDWRRMAQSSLGPVWRQLDEKQRARFVDLYDDLMAAEYGDSINQFQGDERVTIDGSDTGGDTVLVRTTVITHSRERTPVDYLTQRVAGAWRVIDFRIYGVSMVDHLRASYSRFLVNHSFQELVAGMEQKRREVLP